MRIESSEWSVSRRDCIRKVSAWAGWSLSLPTMGGVVYGQSKHAQLNRYPRMLHDWYVAQVRAIDQSHREQIERISNASEAAQYVDTVRSKIRKCFGPEPERTPLNPRTTGTVERDGYRIEKIVFESRPNFYVTANLYLPTRLKGPFPGVIGTCGHSSNGKAAEAYQSYAQGLARLGMACLIYDPLGQGERLQYVQNGSTSKIGVGVQEHLHAGNQQFLVGEFLGAWHAWDGIRALDYLLTRPEVDPKRVGVTGNSGGGTQTTWLCGLDTRWTMAAPACFVTSFRRNLENELPADTEQCPPLALSLGLDHLDFLEAMAPKPVIILAKERDYFDARGSEEAYRRLKHIYTMLGAAENIALFIGPTEHGYSQENREAMYSWFAQAANVSIDTSRMQSKLTGTLSSSRQFTYVQEPALVVESDETLRCTQTGQVAENPNALTVFETTRSRARQLASNRQSHSGVPLVELVKKSLCIPDIPKSSPEYRIWQYLGSRGYPSKSGVAYAIDTEKGIEAIVYQLTKERRMSRPAQAEKDRPACLYLPNLSSDEELRSEPLLRELASNPMQDIFTCDARGVGESQPDTCGPDSFRKPYGSEYFYAIHGLMLNKPLLGQRVFDVLCVLEWIKSFDYTHVHLVGVGRGSLIATLAAVVCPFVRQITVKGSIDSWTAIAEQEYYEMPLCNVVPNVLERFDLPDCYRALQSKMLRRL